MLIYYVFSFQKKKKVRINPPLQLFYRNEKINSRYKEKQKMKTTRVGLILLCSFSYCDKVEVNSQELETDKY